jgi:hypothetical protein
MNGSKEHANYISMRFYLLLVFDKAIAKTIM